jgi:NAD-dependent dihydropyrimidine dehydrogenase PreA subunit
MVESDDCMEEVREINSIHSNMESAKIGRLKAIAPCIRDYCNRISEICIQKLYDWTHEQRNKYYSFWLEEIEKLLSSNSSFTIDEIDVEDSCEL